MEADELRVSRIADVLQRDIEDVLVRILDKNSETSYDQLLAVFLKSIEQFQPCPQLLDGTIKSVVERLADSYLSKVLVENGQEELGKSIGVIFYNYAKIRGVKPVSNCFKSDIYFITKVLQRLKATQFWQERYFLLLWLSILVLAPFPLDKIATDLSSSIYSIASHYLNSSGKENDAASILMARLLSRNDSSSYLQMFFDENFKQSQWKSKSTFSQIGILTTTNLLLKIASYDALEPILNSFFQLIHSRISEPVDTKVMRLYVKNMGKLSLLFISSDDFEKVEEIIETFLSTLGHKDTVIRYTLAKQFSKLSLHLDTDFVNELLTNLFEEFDIPNLDADSNDLNTTLQVNSETINIEKYHGILLTIGELTRLKIIPLTRLNTVVSVLNKTLFVEQHRLTFSMGSNVRDSSCFVAWAMAKKYRSDEFQKDTLILLFKILIVTACYDRDLMIRRASAACIQELIGRHGNIILLALQGNSISINEKKVKLIETLDYASLGQLKKSFEISLQISSDISHVLKTTFLDFLLNEGITSLNYEVRKQSCYTLFDFMKNEPRVDTFLDILLLKMGKHNGVLYAISLLLPLADDISAQTVEIVHYLESLKYDYHKESYHKGEEIILLLKSLKQVNPNFEITENQYELIFNIIRQNDDSITESFIGLAGALVSVPEKYVQKWLYYIRNGNVTAAKAIGYATCIMQNNIDKLMELISDTSLDAALRSSMIESISFYFEHGSRNIGDEITTDLLLKITENLDDYTITSQGDVGSLIRSSTIKLIWNNYTLFLSNDDVLLEVERRLIRLAGEVMDRIRVSSLTLLVKLKGWYPLYRAKFPNTPCIEDDNLTFINSEQFFDFLLYIYHVNYSENFEEEKIANITIELWKGYCFSGGAIQASEITINSAVHSFLNYWEPLSDAKRSQILKSLLTILKPDPLLSSTKTKNFKAERFTKLQNSCLKFWINLLDLNMPIPSDFNISGLFVRTFNLHLNTSNVVRLQSAIKIFVILYLKDQTQFTKCLERLEWISKKHPIANIRAAAQEGLAEVEWELQQKKA